MIVASLNVGFGLVEIVGGFIAKSRALKPHELAITFVASLALACTAAAKAKVALTQGIFVALLGHGVVGLAIWRALNTAPRRLN